MCDLPHRDALTHGFFRACLAVDIPQNSDYNGARYEGVAYLQLSSRRGRRCSSARGYLRKARTRHNLHLTLNALVTAIVLEGERAVGVVYRRDDNSEWVARTSGEVVLCAGAANSPRLLELSGIGDGERLRALGIAPKRHLAGVGENLRDHLNTRMTYRCTDPITVNDALNTRWRGALMALRYVVSGRGLMATPSVTVHALVRSSPERESADLKLQITHLSGENRYAMAKDHGIDRFSGFMLGSTPLHPESRGSVHVRSPDPALAPEIRANYLSAPADVSTTLYGLKLLRRLAQQSELKKLIVEEIRPGIGVQSDAELLDFIRASAQTSWHPIGTCKMGHDAMSVVDAELNVQGVSSLRVADVSVLPHVVSSNPNAPAMMIGERCADFILRRG